MITALLAASIISTHPAGLSVWLRHRQREDDIVGIVENHTDSTYEYLTLSCKLYNAAGQVTGTSDDSLINLGPREAWSVNLMKYSWQPPTDHFSCSLQGERK